MPGLSAGLVLLAAAATAAPAGWTTAVAGDAATAARLQAHQQAAARLTSIQADVVTHTTVPPRRTVGRIVLRGPDAYYRVAEEGPTTERVLQETAATAQVQVTINHEARVATRVDLTRIRDAAPDLHIPNGARDLLDTFAQATPGSVHYLGPTDRNGATLDQFRVTAVVGDEPAGELLVWAAPEDGLPRRVELRGPAGRLLLERDFVNVKLNAPVPDAIFTLAIPQGVTLHDVSDEYLGPAAADAQPAP